MRAFIVGLVSGFVALAGFAGSASASATVDLIWQSTGTSTISGVAVSDSITLDVMLTAGALGSNGGSVSIDYSAVAGILSVTSASNDVNGGFGSPFWGIPIAGAPTFLPLDGLVHHINYGSICGGLGTCLGDPTLWGDPPGPGVTTARIGTVTFNVDALPGGSLDILVGLFDGADGVGNAIGGNANPSFNAGSIAPVPEPGTLSLLGMGLGGLYVVGRRSRPKH
jgi:hypothetical protein